MMFHSSAALLLALMSPLSLNAAEECQTITEIACSTPDFSDLCKSLEVTGLNKTLNGKGPFTVFAPINEAFDELPESVVDELDTKGVLANILLYHVILDEVVLSTDLVCNDLVEMANERDTRTVCEDKKVFQKGGGNSETDMPEIIGADVIACNGVIHVVNEVILPAHEADSDVADCMTITEIVCSVPEFSTLCAQVGSADLAETLETGIFTLFAPTNEAFDDLDREDRLAMRVDRVLKDVLLFHTVPDVVLDKLTCGDLVTMTNGKDSRTRCTVGGRKFQKGPGNSFSDWPRIIGDSMEACNGLIWTVDEVMLPIDFD